MESDDQNEYQLTNDAMRLVCQHVEDAEDQAALTRLSRAWRHALKTTNQEFWRQEWDIFQAEHSQKDWFTTEVLDYSERRESRLSEFLNNARNLVGKDEKEHLSFRQRIFENQVVMENPTYVDLLLTNRQHQLNAMTTEERGKFFKKLNAERPHLRTTLKNLAAIPGAVILGVLGLALVPPGLVVQSIKMGVTGIPERRMGGCGENAGVGICRAVEDYWPLAPAGLSFFASYSLLNMFANDASKVPGQLRTLYKTTAAYLKKEDDKSQ